MENIDLNLVASPDEFFLLSPEEQEFALSLNSIKEIKKGTVFLKEGQHIKEFYFLVTGCVRQFQLVDGSDFTIDFYTNQQEIFLPALTSEIQISSSNFECLVDSRISITSHSKVIEGYKRFPNFEKMCRIQSEKDLINNHAKFSKFKSSTPEQRYLDLLETRPELIELVPQYHLASYLGIKPESLSRIRKRLSKK